MLSRQSLFYFLGTLQVVIPKMEYKGQMLSTLVSKNIIATAIAIIAMVPEIKFEKYSVANPKAITTLIILSVDPMFLFISKVFK